MSVPEAVRQAAQARTPARFSRAVGLSREARRGDLRLIAPPYTGEGQTRLGLVLEVAADGTTAEMALTHSSPDLATAFDGIVPGAVAGTSFPVVVQSDLRGMVWIGQVGARLGHLAPWAVETISRLVAGEDVGDAEGVDVGTRLLGPTDRRWAFKEAEGAALDALCGDCATELVRGPAPWQLGRELLLPEKLSATTRLSEVAEELAHWFETRDVRVDLETALWLEASGALEESAWIEAGLSFDTYEMVLSAVEVGILSARPATTSWSRSLRGPAVGDDVSTEHEVVHVLGRRARMVTA